MKKVSLLILLFLLGASLKGADKVSWEFYTKYITTSPKAVMYLVDGIVYRPSFVQPTKVYERVVFNYEIYKAKKINKPQRLEVLGYANLNKQMEYDTYVVSYKDKKYCIHSKYVSDNSLLKEVNNELKDQYSERIKDYESSVKELDSLIQTHLPICEKNYNYYKELEQRMPRIIDSTKVKIESDYDAAYKAEFDKWYNKLPKSTRNAYSKIEVTYSSLHSWNSVGGCNYSFFYNNKTNKTIKYCRVYGTFYNAVNDVVFCDITGDCTFTGTETGPIPPGAQGGGYWSNVIYDYAVDHIVVNNVNYTFTDGTTMSLSGADVKRMLEWQDLEEKFIEEYGRKNTLIDNAVKRLEKDKARYSDEAKDWGKLLTFLQSGGRYNHLFDKYNKHYEFCERLKKIATTDMTLQRRYILNFEKNNLIEKSYFE